MTKFGLMAATAIFGISAVVSQAHALVVTQTQNFGFSGLSGSTGPLSFNGFNAGLGTLTDVVISITGIMSLTFTGKVDPFGSGNQTVTSGAATGTLTITPTGVSFFGPNPSASLSTTPFTGIVFDNAPQAVLGSATNFVNGTSGSIGAQLGGALLPQYIGGTNLYSLTLSSSSQVTGTIPGGVLIGNNGNSEGTFTVTYTYTPPSISTPEPASMMLVGAGLLGLGLARRRRG